jgi:hypothetical protein
VITNGDIPEHGKLNDNPECSQWPLEILISGPSESPSTGLKVRRHKLVTHM